MCPFKTNDWEIVLVDVNAWRMKHSKLCVQGFNLPILGLPLTFERRLTHDDMLNCHSFNWINISFFSLTSLHFHLPSVLVTQLNHDFVCRRNCWLLLLPREVWSIIQETSCVPLDLWVTYFLVVNTKHAKLVEFARCITLWQSKLGVPQRKQMCLFYRNARRIFTAELTGKPSVEIPADET